MKEEKKTGRLDLIIPGYSGHIPLSALPKELVPDTHIAGGHIPGYAGYVCKIKPENLFGKTFGCITETVQRGDDVSVNPMLTTSQHIYVDQASIRQKTAAESVGVAPKSPEYRKPSPEELRLLTETLKQIDHNSACDCQALASSCHTDKENRQNTSCLASSCSASGQSRSGCLKDSDKSKSCSKKVTFNDGAVLHNTCSSSQSEDSGQYAKTECDQIKSLLVKTDQPHSHTSQNFIEHAVPGYCGHRRKIYADNVYGKTFRTCEVIAKTLLEKAETRQMEVLKTNEEFLPNLHRTIN